MAPRIGVYDSGTGGLTTLALLRAKLPQCSFLYYADTARMPFGSKSREEIFECAGEALRVLRRETDIVVFGCNTASVTVRPKDVFCLHPDLDSCDPQRTLMLATPATVAATDARGKGFLTADTSELAVLVEVRLSLRFKSRTRLDCSDLEDYLKRRLAPFAGRADRVLIGCSHYVYAEREIARITGVSDCRDGNDTLTESVARAVYGSEGAEPIFLRENTPDASDVSFIFTGGNESAKYRWILSRLAAEYVPEILTKRI